MSWVCRITIRDNPRFDTARIHRDDSVRRKRPGTRRIKCLGSRGSTNATRVPRPNARKKRWKTRADYLYLHLGIHSEGIRSSKIATCHVGPVVQEIHIHTSRGRLAYGVLIRHRLGHLCSRRAGGGPKASCVCWVSRHSAEGEHSRGPEGSSIGRALSLLSCKIEGDNIN